MPINATCQQCGATLPVPDEYAGKSVRCGGCQGVVNVPARAEAAPNVPVAKAPRARPVAVPVAAKERPAPKPEVPVPKARKAREEDDAEPDDEPKARTSAKRRPIAKRRRESVLTPTAFKWLSLFLVTGTVGLGVLAYAGWGASRKNDGTAFIPAEVPPAPQPDRVMPVAPPNLP
ncbi:hypothetical protein [Limnoglobus roseus]|uniref:Uncharacterized protein n=1 Tax=Limnoglobus roseus TaxID=2598579 RepID=A0A5C1AFP8_9BACT|nr:hypothetical protein [Limnoglobus roseus]QEL18081.1 hypothetical protein PX52LOC_05095 [Limnoglobus roseus]